VVRFGAATGVRVARLAWQVPCALRFTVCSTGNRRNSSCAPCLFSAARTRCSFCTMSALPSRVQCARHSHCFADTQCRRHRHGHALVACAAQAMIDDISEEKEVLEQQLAQCGAQLEEAAEGFQAIVSQ
jgi:hypothetical protein